MLEAPVYPSNLSQNLISRTTEGDQLFTSNSMKFRIKEIVKFSENSSYWPDIIRILSLHCAKNSAPQNIHI